MNLPVVAAALVGGWYLVPESRDPRSPRLNGAPVGELTIRPHNQRFDDAGAARVVRRATRLTHRGTTVTARLALRLDGSLAGQTLGADVEATDRRPQVERNVARIRVAD